MSSDPIRVLLVDDHAVVRNGVRMMLSMASDICVAAEAETALEAKQLAASQTFDVALIDIGLPGMGGLDLLKLLKSTHPELAVLILSMYTEEMYAVRALKLGAVGYLNKNASADTLIDAVRKASRGHRYISPALASRLADMFIGSAMTSHELLSNRELEVMRMIASGHSLITIGELLHLSPSTVTTYRARILDKMGMKSNAELTRYASMHGLVV
jgi:DNA-binding NarL/FixJ family response regulator